MKLSQQKQTWDALELWSNKGKWILDDSWDGNNVAYDLKLLTEVRLQRGKVITRISKVYIYATKYIIR